MTMPCGHSDDNRLDGSPDNCATCHLHDELAGITAERDKYEGLLRAIAEDDHNEGCGSTPDDEEDCECYRSAAREMLGMSIGIKEYP